jgi:hypothetical protein
MLTLTLSLPFLCYDFTDGSINVIVSNDWQDTRPVTFDFSCRNRILAALLGIPNSGQRMIEVGYWHMTEPEAKQALQHLITSPLALETP